MIWEPSLTDLTESWWSVPAQQRIWHERDIHTHTRFKVIAVSEVIKTYSKLSTDVKKKSETRILKNNIVSVEAACIFRAKQVGASMDSPNI